MAGVSEEDVHWEGHGLLVDLGRYGGPDVKPAFVSYLKPNTLGRCQSACHALREVRGEWAVELLGPLLTDRRETDATYAVDPEKKERSWLRERICDMAAETIGLHNPELKFELRGTHRELDQQIEKIRKQIMAGKKP